MMMAKTVYFVDADGESRKLAAYCVILASYAHKDGLKCYLVIDGDLYLDVWGVSIETPTTFWQIARLKRGAEPV